MVQHNGFRRDKIGKLILQTSRHNPSDRDILLAPASGSMMSLAESRPTFPLAAAFWPTLNPPLALVGYRATTAAHAKSLVTFSYNVCTKGEGGWPRHDNMTDICMSVTVTRGRGPNSRNFRRCHICERPPAAGGLIPDMSPSRHETSDDSGEGGRADRNCASPTDIQSSTNHLTDGRERTKAQPYFFIPSLSWHRSQARCMRATLADNAEMAPSSVDGCKSP